MGVLSSKGLGGVIVGMYDAHDNVIKFTEESVIHLLSNSISETRQVGFDVILNELEGVLPGEFIIQCLGSLEMLETETKVVSCPGVVVVLFVVLGKGGGTGENFTWTLRADVNVDSLADLHVCEMDLVGMHSFDVKDKVALGFQALVLAP